MICQLWFVIVLSIVLCVLRLAVFDYHVGEMVGSGLWFLTPYFNYILAVTFIGGGNRNKRKPTELPQITDKALSHNVVSSTSRNGPDSIFNGFVVMHSIQIVK